MFINRDALLFIIPSEPARPPRNLSPACDVHFAGLGPLPDCFALAAWSPPTIRGHYGGGSVRALSKSWWARGVGRVPVRPTRLLLIAGAFSTASFLVI